MIAILGYTVCRYIVIGMGTDGDLRNLVLLLLLVVILYWDAKTTLRETYRVIASVLKQEE